MTPSELDRYAAHLRSTMEIFAVVTDPQVTPRRGSPADRELAEARTLSASHGIWGEDRVRTAYQAALMSYTAALDEGLAMAAMITGGVRTAIPAVVLSRSIAEVCGQAWWLLEPGVGARGRVERLQCLRLRSAIEGERAAEADGIDPADWLRARRRRFRFAGTRASSAWTSLVGMGMRMSVAASACPASAGW